MYVQVIGLLLDASSTVHRCVCVPSACTVTEESAPLSIPYRTFVAPFLCFMSLPANRGGGGDDVSKDLNTHCYGPIHISNGVRIKQTSTHSIQKGRTDRGFINSRRDSINKYRKTHHRNYQQNYSLKLKQNCNLATRFFETDNYCHSRQSNNLQKVSLSLCAANSSYTHTQPRRQ